jgi:NAD(P)-dependent dehydrogenase (short-subunit alcohol dehydrogenase family)
MYADLDISGRVVMITGAGQGIGRVYAQYFVEGGLRATVTILSATVGTAWSRTNGNKTARAQIPAATP